MSSHLAGRAMLLTGAGGFTGSHVVDCSVRDGAEARAFLHYNSRGDCLCSDMTEPLAPRRR